MGSTNRHTTTTTAAQAPAASGPAQQAGLAGPRPDSPVFVEAYQAYLPTLTAHVTARLADGDRDVVLDLVHDAFADALADPTLIGADVLASLRRLPFRETAASWVAVRRDEEVFAGGVRRRVVGARTGVRGSAVASTGAAAPPEVVAAINARRSTAGNCCGDRLVPAAGRTRSSVICGPPSVLSTVIVVSDPARELTGSSACRPFAPDPTSIANVKVDPDHVRFWKDEAFLPSIHSSICSAETMGTPRALADATMASEPAWTAVSVCMFAVNTP